ncbi:hypothetical protein [Leptospira bandrabouensis]|uniref:hypothetical protein n=1 Tax=Leptospira bandrabouensis TaxID=2484903 RepID=UPI001EE964B5|nr:hypothetical protein [Leptospira bandrabouensis]MCG6146627.1 hypothetical protein [Leptospira bandrabouensis]MCG6154031.1 hypothetical protein [Leptospira bandrabouensis]MCG6161990.1 hypothetical protein [Leptospira bandrabouensis]MCG6166204.1 hypothetical protein [Leptospira bandrabouensis]
MINKVLFLGAGFSAPLGIPTMGNFLERAKDLFEDNPIKFRNFEEIFELIKQLHYIKANLDLDLSNIEAILSIIEMGEYVSGLKFETNKFENFIKSVIEESTEPLNFSQNFLRNNLYGATISLLENNIENKYLLYFLSILNISFEILNDKDNIHSITKELENQYERYSIVSVNYDLVVENILNLISSLSHNSSQQNPSLPLSKLHGSIDGKIIPPTWNKTSNNSVQKQWIDSFNLLSKAHEIIFLGYSLPESDAYIKYLLSVSMYKNNNLKKIRVINLDPDGSAQNRYDNLFLSTLKSKYIFERNSVLQFLENELNNYGPKEHKVAKSRIYTKR